MMTLIFEKLCQIWGAFLKRNYICIKNNKGINVLWKHNICMSVCPWIGVKLSAPLHYIGTSPIVQCDCSKLGYRCILWCISSAGVRAKCSPVALRARKTLYMLWLGLEMVWKAGALQMLGVLAVWHQTVGPWQHSEVVWILSEFAWCEILHQQTIKNTDAPTWSTYAPQAEAIQ